jgi:hypothetical protein
MRINGDVLAMRIGDIPIIYIMLSKKLGTQILEFKTLSAEL